MRGFACMSDAQSCPEPETGVAGPFSLKPSEWWCVLKGVSATAERANLALIAGGVAFFGLMAAIPGIAALVALVGVFGDPELIGQQVRALRGVAPDAVILVIYDEVNRLLSTRNDTLVAGAIANGVIAVWSALQGTRWVLMALTAVNRRAEQRTFIRRFVTAGVFTLYGFGLSAAAVLLMGAAPVVLAFLQIESSAEVLLLLLRWPVLGGAAIAVALILYRWGPRRRPPPWRWLWPGALVAPLLWVLASAALTFGLREFPAFGATYGSLAGALAFLLWLYVTAYVFLLGGALNAELEFYASGRPSAPVEKDEAIEPPIAATGGKKEVKAKS